MQNSKKSSSLGILILAVVLTAIIVGGGTYFIVSNNLSNKISQLSAQVSSLTKSSQNTKITTPTINAPSNSGGGSVPTSAVKLNLETLKNITYTSDKGVDTKLVNGKANTPITAGGTQDQYSISLEDNYLIDDINGDGQDEAAVVLAEQAGGNGFFKMLAIVSKSGNTYTGKIVGNLGDRVTINKFENISQNGIHAVWLGGTEWDGGKNTPTSFMYNTDTKVFVKNPKALL